MSKEDYLKRYTAVWSEENNKVWNVVWWPKIKLGLIIASWPIVGFLAVLLRMKHLGSPMTLGDLLLSILLGWMVGVIILLTFIVEWVIKFFTEWHSIVLF